MAVAPSFLQVIDPVERAALISIDRSERAMDSAHLFHSQEE
jgi:hypothetical protein